MQTYPTNLTENQWKVIENIETSNRNGKNARYDQSSPEQSDHLILLIIKKIWWQF